jgi:hypothetical protein
MLLIGIFIHTSWIFSPGYLYGFSPLSLFITFPRTVGAVLIAIGICLSAFAWYEFKHYFNFRWAFFVALFTLLVPWWGVIADLLLYSGLVYVETGPYGAWGPGPLAMPFNTLILVSNTLFGILMILWGVSLIYIRKNSQSHKLTLGAGIIFIILAHMTLLVIPILLQMVLISSYPLLLYGYYSLLPAIILEIGVILTAIFYYRLAASLKPY